MKELLRFVSTLNIKHKYVMGTIALDIGGTKISSAIFLSNGEMLSVRKRLLKGRTGHDAGRLAAEILEKQITIARQSMISVESIGVCVPGIVYSQTDRVWAPNIPGWGNYPLKEILSACLKGHRAKIYMDSDRNCYMYGEMWQGNAKDVHSAVFMAVGTGIGAGIIMDDRVLHGVNDIVGAVGWTALQAPYIADYDTCGCFEFYASGNGIGSRARDAVRADKSYKGKLRQKPISRITAHDVFAAYGEGDPIAVSVLRKAIEMWGMASANLVSLLNPQRIIWGGGVFGPATGFIDDIYKEASKWAQPISIKQVEFAASGLSGNAGLIGAAYLAIKNRAIDILNDPDYEDI